VRPSFAHTFGCIVDENIIEVADQRQNKGYDTDVNYCRKHKVKCMLFVTIESNPLLAWQGGSTFPKEKYGILTR